MGEAHLTEDDCLTNRDDTVDVLNGLILFVLITATHIVLCDVVKRFLLAQQFDDDWIFNDVLSKFHHRTIVCG